MAGLLGGPATGRSSVADGMRRPGVGGSPARSDTGGTSRAPAGQQANTPPGAGGSGSIAAGGLGSAGQRGGLASQEAGPAPACAPADLQAAINALSAGTGGQELAFVELRDTSARPCSVAGYPGVDLLGPAGQVLPTSVQAVAFYPETVVTLRPDTPAIEAGRPLPGQGVVGVFFNADLSPSGLCLAPQVENATWLVLRLPRGGAFVLPARAPAEFGGREIASCRGALQVSAVAPAMDARVAGG